MAVYTTLLRNIVEEKAGLVSSKGYASVNELITKAVPLIFNFDFPIFDERYRNVLCSKILKHYYMREIGTETYGLWHLYLDTTLNEIMPYYNKLYETELLKFNPLYDIDLKRTHNNKTIEQNREQPEQIKQLRNITIAVLIQVIVEQVAVHLIITTKQ